MRKTTVNSVVWAWVVGAVLACRITAAAPVVDITTGLALGLTSGSSGSLTLSVQNNGDATADVNFYQFAVMLIQTSGTASLTIDSWTSPASNPLLGDPVAFTFSGGTQDLISPVTIDGTEYYAYYPLQAENIDSTDWQLDAAKSANVGVLTFTAGPADDLTVSTWDIYVVNQSYESPAFPPTVFTNSALAVTEFGNVPAVDGQALKIGTVTVTAVPEPGTVTLLASGMVCAAVAAWRRRRRAA